MVVEDLKLDTTGKFVDSAAVSRRNCTFCFVLITQSPVLFDSTLHAYLENEFKRLMSKNLLNNVCGVCEGVCLRYNPMIRRMKFMQFQNQKNASDGSWRVAKI